jgi:hypothetical protein
MQRQLIFLIESRLDERDYARFGIQYLSGRYRVRVLDCTHFVYTRIPTLPPAVADASYQYTPVSSRQDVSDVAPVGAGSIVVDMLGETIAANAVRRQVLCNGGLRVALRLGGLHFTTSPWHDRLAAQMSKVWKPDSLQRFLQRLVTRAEKMLAPVPPVDLWVYGGKAGSDWGAASVVYAHSFDYERWRTLGDPTLPQSGSYALFLDEDIVHHSDYARFGLQPPVSEAAYYPAINRFFDEYQRATGLPVYVAEHPRARYAERPQLWGDRTLIHGQTPEAVISASQVFAHFSTAISFAILANRPVTHLVSDELLQSFMGPQVVGVSRFLNTRLVNIDRTHSESVATVVDQIDVGCYGVYKNLYLKADHSVEGPLWEIIADAAERQMAGSV